MKYPYSKQEYLEFQNMIFDEFEKIIDENNINCFQFELVERPIFFRPSNDVMSYKYTVNSYHWLQELSYLRDQIVHEILLASAYERVSNVSVDGIKGGLKYIDRDRYLKLGIIDIVAYMDKLANLIYELLDRRITFKGNHISFMKLAQQISKINTLEYYWLSDIEIDLIIEQILLLSNDEKLNRIRKLRNQYVHNGNPGIDSIGLCLHNFEVYKDNELKYLREYDMRHGDPNWATNMYMNVGAKEVLKKISYDEVQELLFYSWNILSGTMVSLIEGIKILKNEVVELIK